MSSKNHHHDEESAEPPAKKISIALSQSDSSFTSVVAKHYNTIEEKGLHLRNESRIVYLRNFNNWIKSMLINEFANKLNKAGDRSLSLKVLDMCCGKGGDLLKWKNNNVKHLICVDLAEVSVKQCEQRYIDMKMRCESSRHRNEPLFEAEFLVGDCTKVRLKDNFKKSNELLDIVSCQFSFHYCFESLLQAECMIRNAADNLKPGGFFIGTIPDANDIVARLRKTDSNVFGNDIFKIQFPVTDEFALKSFQLFGAKYEFFLEGVVNCPEFLVHFPTFVRLAEKFNLKLVMKERFQEYYNRMKEEGRDLLGRMQALESYPSFENEKLLGKSSSEYIHADCYLNKEKTADGVRVGTLSKSEWEAASLYLAFAFIKIAS